MQKEKPSGKINVKGLRWRFMGPGEGISVQRDEPGKDVEGKELQGRRNSMTGAPRREWAWGTEGVKRKPAHWDSEVPGTRWERRSDAIHPDLPGPRRLGRGVWHTQSAREPLVRGSSIGSAQWWPWFESCFSAARTPGEAAGDLSLSFCTC